MYAGRKASTLERVVSHRPSMTTQEALKVTAHDLAHVSEALRLLSVLNNQFAAAQDLAPSVEKMPTLVARVRHAYSTLYINRPQNIGLSQLLGGLGNRRFEELLFKYLEDLTELKASLPED
jgi:hypothetical protein